MENYKNSLGPFIDVDYEDNEIDTRLTSPVTRDQQLPMRDQRPRREAAKKASRAWESLKIQSSTLSNSLKLCELKGFSF